MFGIFAFCWYILTAQSFFHLLPFRIFVVFLLLLLRCLRTFGFLERFNFLLDVHMSDHLEAYQTSSVAFGNYVWHWHCSDLLKRFRPSESFSDPTSFRFIYIFQALEPLRQVLFRTFGLAPILFIVLLLPLVALLPKYSHFGGHLEGTISIFSFSDHFWPFGSHFWPFEGLSSIGLCLSPRHY